MVSPGSFRAVDGAGGGVVVAIEDVGEFFDEGGALGVGERDGDGGGQRAAKHLVADEFGEGDDAVAFECGGGEGVGEHGFPEGQVV